VSATSVETPAAGSDSQVGEPRFTVYGVSWKAYVAIRKAFDRPSLRLSYLGGALEFMSPSDLHESFKKRIARLIELFALERDVPLYGYGSTTFRRRAREAGLEPDECYVLGRELVKVPDLAIEVALTSGGVSKLEIYARLGVREVWFWTEAGFTLHALTGPGYEQIQASGLIPQLDVELLSRYVRRSDQPKAIREYRDAIREERK
jgi:Uma2 family endonuclease